MALHGIVTSPPYKMRLLVQMEAIPYTTPKVWFYEFLGIDFISNLSLC